MCVCVTVSACACVFECVFTIYAAQRCWSPFPFVCAAPKLPLDSMAPRTRSHSSPLSLTLSLSSLSRIWQARNTHDLCCDLLRGFRFVFQVCFELMAKLLLLLFPPSLLPSGHCGSLQSWGVGVVAYSKSLERRFPNAAISNCFPICHMACVIWSTNADKVGVARVAALSVTFTLSYFIFHMLTTTDNVVIYLLNAMCHICYICYVFNPHWHLVT